MLSFVVVIDDAEAENATTSKANDTHPFDDYFDQVHFSLEVDMLFVDQNSFSLPDKI